MDKPEQGAPEPLEKLARRAGIDEGMLGLVRSYWERRMLERRDRDWT